MNSYLDNLVLRTLALAPVAQPRLASVFESSPVVGVAAQGPGQGELTGGAEARPADASRSLPQQVHTTVQLVQPPPENKVAVPSNRIRNADVDDLGRSKPVERREAKPKLPVAESPAAVRNQNPITGKPHTGRETWPVAVDKETLKPLSESRSKKLPTADVVPADGDGLWRRLEPRVRQVVRDELPEQATPENTRENPPAVQPRVASAPELKHDLVLPATPAGAVFPSAPVPIAPPAPEITVTIGRVEVRAIVSSSAPTARTNSPRPPSPTSLDQYLKERSEGRR